jgi:acyl-CoA synthetase (NDP forming)
VIPPVAGIDRERAESVISRALSASADTWLTPEDARSLVGAYGISFVPERAAGSLDEAVAAASDLGFPVAVKTAVPGVHKTETGGVALDLADEEQVRRAVARIGCPVTVQAMAERGTELLAGVTQDPVFGPLVAFGPGGTMAELIGDAGFRIAPLTDVDARELVSTGKAGKLVRGYRGAPAADQDALTDLLHRLSRLGESHPEVAELDLNPVIAGLDGCVAVDARVRIRAQEAARSSKTW